MRGAGEVREDLYRAGRGGFWESPGVWTGGKSPGKPGREEAEGQSEPQGSRKHSGHSESTMLALK